MTPAQLAILVAAVCSNYLAVVAVPSGNHTCTGVTKIPVTVLVNVTVPVTFRSYTWCLRVPPRCSKYTVQLRDRVQLHTEMHNKTITICCRGYVEMDGRCVPACPEGADCPFMHCNRTNHCHCTPGYTGLYCNDPCPRGVWGRDCKRPCDCPPGYTCHHLTGDCMVDERAARRTTTTTVATTTTRAPTTSLFTTEATTLETVKTPQFRFPPPPWVEAAGTTTAKKLTTRVIKDETTPLPTQKKMEEITPAPTFPTTEIKQFKPPLIEFFLPSSTVQATMSKKPRTTEPVVETTLTNLSSKKKVYLPVVTERKTAEETMSKITIPMTVTPSTTTATTPTTTPPIPTMTTIATIPTTTATSPTTTATSPTTTVTTPIRTITTQTPTLTVATDPLTTTTNNPTTMLITAVPTTESIASETTTHLSPATQTTPKPLVTIPPLTTTIPTTETTIITTETTTTEVAMNSPTIDLTTPTKETTIKITQTAPTTSTSSPTTISTVLENTSAPEKEFVAPIITTTTAMPTKEFGLESRNTRPEFKVIKVIKTDQLPQKPQKATTKVIVPPEVHPPNTYSNQSLENISETKETGMTNIKINVHQQKSKEKDDGSRIFYISPTTKATIPPSVVQQTIIPEATIHFRHSTKGTTIKKDRSNTGENEIHFREVTDGLLKVETTAPVNEENMQHSNSSLLHSLFSQTKVPNLDEIDMGYTTVNQQHNIDDNVDLQPINNKMKITEITPDHSIERTTQANKKKNKDRQTKGNEKLEGKSFNELTTESTTIVLSPIHLLKQLLNATSKPRTTTTAPVMHSKPDEYLSPRAYEDDFTKEIISKKAKYDDLITYSMPEKGKKKHDKSKGAKHLKDGKEQSLITPFKIEKHTGIPLPPQSKPQVTTTTEMTERVTFTAEVLKTTKPTLNIEVVTTSEKSSNEDIVHATARPYIETQVTFNVVKKDIVSHENDFRRFTTQNDVNTPVTENSNIVESNTIDTLRTSIETVPKKGLEEEQEDSNYSLLFNKMKKVEVNYGAAGYSSSRSDSSEAAMLMTLGIGVITLLLLAGFLWIYQKRRRLNAQTMQPYIMAYELRDTPLEELQELDHPKSSHMEPLYAEVRY